MRQRTQPPNIFLIALLLAAGLACSFAAPTPLVIVVTATPPPGQLQATDPPVLPSTPASIPATLPPAETLTPEVQQFFTEEFDNGRDNWKHFLTKGDESDLDFYTGNGILSFDINGTDLWAYAVYEPYVYDNVRIDVSVANRGNNDNYTTLLCRYDQKKGWYEFNIKNDGLYHIYFGQWRPGQTTAAYATLYDGGSSAIRTGMAVNEFTVICDGNTLTLFINGTKVRAVNSEFGLQSGQVGIGASSFDRIPVALDFEWVKISKP